MVVSHAVLITQCMQRDFVAPLAPHASVPNKLHVGRREARRLLSAQPERGPLAQLMEWARNQPVDALDVVHIRDWHDPEDPAQQAHLERFGLHCIQETPGAELVLGLGDDVDERDNERFVNSISLNDFASTDLGEVLDGIRDRAGEEPLRIGVVGVWTEAKVKFLLYELRTRCNIDALATCSALTASASRSQHFNALEQLRKILGIEIFDSVGNFADWLRPGGESVRAPDLPTNMRPELEFADGDAGALPDSELELVSYLYRDSSRLKLQSLGGGFSGADVFRVQSWDAMGHRHASTVLKLGPRDLIGEERVSFERVESILGQHAPKILGFADFGERAGIKYEYAAMGTDEVQTFKSLYEEGAPQKRVDPILENVFDGILGEFYSASEYERLPLLDYYGFDSKYADGIREKIAQLPGLDGSEETIEFPGGFTVPNVADFYADQLPDLPRVGGAFHYVSYVHGDLNGANILLDGRDNVWLIDFFHAHRGHVLRDLAKLENDLLYIFTPVDDESELEEALTITRALREVEDLRTPLPETLDGLRSEQFLRAWKTLRTLRSIAGRVCRDGRNPIQMSIALLRYAVHTLSFEQSSPLQKRWALAASGGHAEDIVEVARRNRALRVDWVEGPPLSKRDDAGRMGLTICPGRGDHGRSLDADLEAICATGASNLLCLVTSGELEWAGVADLPDAAARHDLDFHHAPIVDQGVPTAETMAELVDWVRRRLDAGEDVVIHCMGGLGRSGTVAACTLVDYGATPERAIEAVRDARGPRAVETEAQEEMVGAYVARSPA